MGLAEPRKRRKISNDPNNTTWSRATDNYGHRILVAQGWTPGKYLGAENANHTSHYTAANASHIRVLLRPDNLGLGVRNGTGAENFGLGGFQDILGRLNGKNEVQIEKDQEMRKASERRVYAGQRWGVGRFVSGGFLVSDKIDEMPARETQTLSEGVVNKMCKDKASEDFDVEEGRSPVDEEAKMGKIEKKNRSNKKQRRKDRPASVESMNEKHSEILEVSEAARRRRKQERRTRRRAKTALKGSKRSRKHGDNQTPHELNNEPSNVATSSVQTSQMASGYVSADELPPTPSTDTSPPLPPNALPNRQAVRQRYIQQKKMASLDQRALREILMLKA